MLFSIINGDMLDATREDGEHVAWDTPDTYDESVWRDLLGQDIAEYAADNPHLFVWQDDSAQRYPIPDNSFYDAMRSGHVARKGHALKGHVVIESGISRLVRDCCGEH